ncbi:penicillin-binding transpeptidase domain-containing protein [Lacticaseibacillus kribbianus]|uniref:penicillin-binding transpeptidase domain-containing protein n=1 Tax=Lacticaseibacillus kribbianus TaxID=2926292 RepID=UPI001CD6403B|nr:penicillin-binding transpeptidase domain-containing protein [Lacticaseibacillus kribbianus]
MKKLFSRRQTNARHPEFNRKLFGILLIGLTAAIGLAFVCRFAYVALGGSIDSKDLKTYRNNQYHRDAVLPAKRGAIYDRHGSVIAEDANTYTLYAVLSKKTTDGKANVDGKTKLYVTDKAKTAQVLAKYLPLTAKQILAYLNPKGNPYQVEFGKAGRGLSLAIKNQIEAAKLTGIGFTDSPSRLYPNGDFASYTIGLATPPKDNSTKNPLVGVMGLEQQFNTLLSGTDGYTSSQYDVYGFKLPQAKTKVKQAVNGGSVTTTLDASLQSYLETLMTKVATAYRPKVLNAVLMNAKTGEILAASSRPTFDPSTREGLTSWRNALVEDVYEPGSVMKIVTLASAIEAGTYRPDEYYQSGRIKVAGGTVADWNDGEGWGSIPLSQAFTRSSNTGMVRIEQELGEANEAKYLKAFHFAEATGVALPNENAGTYSLKNPLQRLNISFGQGISVNVMQMLQATTAIANGGTMIQPRLIKKTVSKTGKVTTYKRRVVGQPISANTATQVLDAMRKVVTEDYGTGAPYAIKGVDMAMKTGTAQIPRADGKGYVTEGDNALHSVMAIAPASNPKYIVYVTLQQSQKNVEVPIATKINQVFQPLLKRALALDASTAASGASTQATVPAVTNDAVATAQTAVTEAKLAAAVVGTGNRVVAQLPQAKTAALTGARVLLLTNGAMTMPDVSGWSKSDVLKLAQLTGKKFKLSGTGYASHQSLASGALLGDDPVTVTFANTK